MRWMIAVMTLGTAVPCASQQVDSLKPKGIVFVELAGNSLLGMTANIEFPVGAHLALRGGMGMDIYTSTLVFPFQAVLVTDSRPWALEASVGVTVVREAHEGDWHWNGTKPFLTGFAGFRYRSRGGFIMRIGVVPLQWTNKHAAWVALSFGDSF